MFTDKFLEERRYAFAEQLEQAMYDYGQTDSQTGEYTYKGTTMAYFMSRTITDNTILLTMRLPNIQGYPHTVKRMYLIYKDVDVTKITEQPLDKDGNIDTSKVIGYFDLGDLGEGVSVNAYQSFAVRVRIQYRETDEGYVTSTTSVKVVPE